jgi:HSP20 family protein
MKTLVKQNSMLFPSLPSLLEDFFNRDWTDSSIARRSVAATLPAVNIREDNDQFLLEVAAPGMKRDDFKVELDNSVLTISSDKGENHVEQNGAANYARREFNYQAFQRSFSLPEDKVEGDKIAARYTDGILHISIPKKDEAKLKPIKKITVG